MSTVEKSIRLYAWKTNYQTFRVVQGEANSRKFNIQLFSTTIPVDLTNCEVMFYAVKPDSTKVYVECEVIDAENGLASVTLTDQMCVVDGTVDCWVQVIGEGGTDLRFEGMNIEVSPCSMTMSIESSDEMKAFLQQSAKLAAVEAEVKNARMGKENLGDKQAAQDRALTDTAAAIRQKIETLASRMDNLVLSSTETLSGYELVEIYANSDYSGSEVSENVWSTSMLLSTTELDAVDWSHAEDVKIINVGAVDWNDGASYPDPELYKTLPYYHKDDMSVAIEMIDDAYAVSIMADEATKTYNRLYVKIVLAYKSHLSIPELEDLKVGADGTKYNTAGEAVRKQIQATEAKIVPVDSTLQESGQAADSKVVGENIDSLKEDLYNKVNNDDIDYNVAKQLSNMVEKIKVDNSWNEDYGNYFDKGNGNLIEYEQMRMCSLSVNAGDIYDIKSRVMYRIALWSMHDSAGNAVKWWNDGNMSLPLDYVEDNGIVIPSGVTELRVYAYVGHLSGYVKKYCLKIKEDSPLKGMTWCPIGDSLTDEATLSGGKNYVDYVSESTGLTVVKNCGVGGTGYLADNKGTSKCFYNRVISTDDDAIPTGVDIYTIFGSFNDMGKFTDDTIGTIESTDISTLIGAMVRSIYAILYKNPDAIVGVIFPTPWASYNNTTIAKRTTTEKYINALQEACEKYSIPYLDLYHQSGLRPWDSNFNKKYYIDDNADGNYTEGVHPNTEGHKKFITPKVLNFIESLVFMN